MRGSLARRSFRAARTRRGYTATRPSPSSRIGYSWDEFLALPSRLSAEPQDRAERQALLDAVARDGFHAGYRGVRVGKSGRRFLIEDGVVWELIDARGIRHGQAATFASWRDMGA